ncbi:MAG: class I SAM-dependent methyltransferase [Candidatus Thiodiazotropha sp. (ex Rostrolucina anterorostrata)]|nr:class I SAM-dependent methyltransferase [Candidatus Thiodiazotropha sp. (ex Rostrolucina anterorostrata)]
MDKITTEVRAFYEAYPYPPEGQVDCDGYHGPLLLSYLQRTCSKLTRLQLLEAGCGRGLNLQTMAGKRTEVDFTGIDINRIAVQEATQRSKELVLQNMVDMLAEQDYEPQQVLQGIQDLVESELLYRPHPEQDRV